MYTRNCKGDGLEASFELEGKILTTRYESGGISAFDDLTRFGVAVHLDPLRVHAERISELMMDRVEKNLRMIQRELVAAGVSFYWLDPLELADEEDRAVAERLDRLVGPLPPAFRGWLRRFHHVNFTANIESLVGDSPRLPSARPVPDESHKYGDGLAVFSAAQMLSQVEATGRLPLGPGLSRKAGQGGELYELLIDRAHTRVLADRMYGFVDYLRHSLSWACLPGLADYARVPELVLRVREQLVPF